MSDHASNEDYCGNNLRSSSCYSPAELGPPSCISQEEDEQHRHVNNHKNQVKLGNKTQHKDCSGRTEDAKAKAKHPVSPYHISSMTVYQKDGGKGFTSCKEGQKQEHDTSDAATDENNFPSSDLRAKWFLSTNQWQGFIPLQIPGTDTLYSEEVSDSENPPACPDDGNEPNAMSATVSQSLEKMKENHSLFYKIACDISISDSDITKNDGNSNTQTASKPEEEELIIAESVEDGVTHNVGTFAQECKNSNLRLQSNVNDNGISNNDNIQDSAPETEDKPALNTSVSPAKEACIYEEISQKECEGTSRQQQKLKVKENNHGASDQDNDSDQTLDEKTKEENSETKESDERMIQRERCEEPKKSNSLHEEDKQRVQEQGNNNSITSSSSVDEGRCAIRSASFGKARVTVIRTSL